MIEVLLIALVTTSGVFTCSMLLGTCLHEAEKAPTLESADLEANTILRVRELATCSSTSSCTLISCVYTFYEDFYGTTSTCTNKQVCFEVFYKLEVMYKQQLLTFL